MTESRTCSCRQAGILINSETLEIMRCDECALFECDADAADAVEALLKLFGKVHENDNGTVADAFDRITAMVESS